MRTLTPLEAPFNRILQMRISLSLAAVGLMAAPAFSQGVNEDFSYSTTSMFPPTGWSNVNNNAGAYPGWEEPTMSTYTVNVGTLNADSASHDDFGGLTTNDNSLHAPTMDLSGSSNTELTFDSDLYYSAYMAHHSSGWGNGTSNVECSSDGGVTWTSVWSETEVVDAFYPGVSADLSAFDGMASVDMQFHYFGDYAHCWAVDNVVVDSGAPAGPALAISGSCPGTMTADASNMTPGGPVVFVYGNSGSWTAAGGPCAGLTLPLDAANHIGSVAADGSGNASISGDVPAGACGVKMVVAVDGSTCTASNAVGI